MGKKRAEKRVARKKMRERNGVGGDSFRNTSYRDKSMRAGGRASTYRVGNSKKCFNLGRGLGDPTFLFRAMSHVINVVLVCLVCGA